MFLNWLLSIISKIFFLTGKVSRKSNFDKPLSTADEKKYFEMYLNGDKNKAEEILVKHNLRLVAHIVKKFGKSSSHDADDLLSVGSIGLLKAIRTYNPENGNVFSTYAARCIENEILMLFRSQKKYLKELSFDACIGKDKDGNEIILENILCDGNENVSQSVELKILAETILKQMPQIIDPREQEILSLRFGLNGNIPHTQQEVSKTLKISRSYVSRIEKSALEKLKEKIEL